MTGWFTRLLLALVLGCSAAYADDLTDSALADVLAKTGQQGAWLVKQSPYWDPLDQRFDTLVSVFSKPSQLTSEICKASEAGVVVRRHKDRSMVMRRLMDKPVVAAGSCAELSRSAVWRHVPGEISDAELAKLFVMAQSLFKTGAIDGQTVQFETEEAKTVIRTAGFVNLVGVSKEPGAIIFTLDVKIPGKVPCVRAMIIAFPRRWEADAIVRIHLEDSADNSCPCEGNDKKSH